MAVLYALDIATTAMGLKLGASEANPITAPFIGYDIVGTLNMTGMKLISLAGIYLISHALIKKGSHVGTYRLHTAVVSLMLVVVVWNLLVIVTQIYN
jgi:hypothetical protein